MKLVEKVRKTEPVDLPSLCVTIMPSFRWIDVYAIVFTGLFLVFLVKVMRAESVALFNRDGKSPELNVWFGFSPVWHLFIK